jgi:hypothetical protein
MALVPSILMNVGGIRADFVHELEVVSSWEMLTDTATIQFPRKVKVEGDTRSIFKELIIAGDPVTIEAGFNGNTDLIFEGSVIQVNPTVPVVIECQDPMKELKESTVTKSWKSVSLKEVIDYIAPNLDKKVLDAELGKFEFERVSPAKVLDALKKRSLYSFFRNGKLQVGLQYDPATANRHEFAFERNIVDDNLEYFAKENVLLKVKAISIGKNNKKTVVEVGDDTGDLRTMHFYDLSEKELKAAAERELDRLKYDGYRGDFKTFGQPTVQHGDIVSISNPTYPEQDGDFWVDKVVRLYGMGGYWQTITLGAAT